VRAPGAGDAPRSVGQALAEFVAHYTKTYPVLEEAFDPEWRSPCELGEPYADAGGIRRIRWEPLPRRADQVSEDFAPLERALECSIHRDIKDYYGAFWSGGLEAEAPDGHVSLILLWNDADLARLLENLIGHALAKQRARSPFSVFFACTEPDSELFLSVENNTGNVLLERPGYPPLREVAPSLGHFLEELVPAPPEQHPERRLLAPSQD